MNEKTGCEKFPKIRATDYFERTVCVMLECENNELIAESNVKFVNIEEDIQGRDMLTFECPCCGDEHTSVRVS
jgi:hypothetical protein